MRTTRQQARNAGLLYLLMILVGLPGLIIVPGKLFVFGDATATASHIRSAWTLFQLGIASEIAGSILYVYLVLAIRRLYEAVDPNAARQMVSLVLLAVALMLGSGLCELGALLVLEHPAYLSTFSPSQLDSLAYLFIRLRGQGIGVAEIFWGLWLIPFGTLTLRCGFVPKIFGVLLLIAAPGYVLRAAAGLFPLPPALDSIGSILSLGEIPNILWLAIAGATTDRREPGPVR